MKVTVIEMNRKDVETECRIWAREIEKTFRPDLVVFIANSGFIFGKVISQELKVPLSYVTAVRSGEEAKNKLGIIKHLIPKWAVKRLICSPMKYYIHSRKKERNVQIPDQLRCLLESGKNKILLVDDAADTGWTIKQTVEKLEQEYEGLRILTAAYSVSEYSKRIIDVDYFLHSDELIITATSRKSPEYEEFRNELENWICNANSG